MTGFYIVILFLGIITTLIALFVVLLDKKRGHDYKSDLIEGKKELLQAIDDAEELVAEMNRISDYVVTQIEEKHGELLATFKKAEELCSNLPVNNNNEEKQNKPKFKNAYTANLRGKEKQPPSVRTGEAVDEINAIPASSNEKKTVEEIHVVSSEEPQPQLPRKRDNRQTEALVNRLLEKIDAEERLASRSMERAAYADARTGKSASPNRQVVFKKDSDRNNTLEEQGMLLDTSMNGEAASVEDEDSVSEYEQVVAIASLKKQDRNEKSERSDKKNKIVPLEARRNEILSLSASGLDYTEIARRLKMGKGEIELIANLEKKKS